MNLYETTFIVDAQLKDEGWDPLVEKYSAIITQNGSIKQLDRWGVRRLAYEINKQTHGYYVHVIHESDPSVPKELERQFKLDENCMRHLTVIADNPKYIEEMNKAKARQAAAAQDSPSPAPRAGDPPRTDTVSTEKKDQPGAGATAEPPAATEAETPATAEPPAATEAETPATAEPPAATEAEAPATAESGTDDEQEKA